MWTELASTSAEVQAELGRGVELVQRAERAEQELRAAKEQAAGTEEALASLRATHEELTRSLAEAEARHATELAAATAAAQPDTEMEQALRSAQERLASQTEKLLEVEERAHEVMAYVAGLSGDFTRFKEDFDLVGKHLGHAQTTFTKADKRLGKLESKLDRAIEGEDVAELATTPTAIEAA